MPERKKKRCLQGAARCYPLHSSAARLSFQAKLREGSCHLETQERALYLPSIYDDLATVSMRLLVDGLRDATPSFLGVVWG